MLSHSAAPFLHEYTLMSRILTRNIHLVARWARFTLIHVLLKSCELRYFTAFYHFLRISKKFSHSQFPRNFVIRNAVLPLQTKFETGMVLCTRFAKDKKFEWPHEGLSVEPLTRNAVTYPTEPWGFKQKALSHEPYESGARLHVREVHSLNLQAVTWIFEPWQI